jgi:hypothetical protein
MRLAARRGPRFRLPRLDRLVGEPHRQASPLPQRSIILRPVRDPIPRLGDVVTMFGMVFERHGEGFQKANGLPHVCRRPFNRNEDPLHATRSPALAWEIDRLFKTRPGPALRHEVAHGQLSGGDCYHPNVYYANWLIYRLCCLFVLRGWDQLVTPHLAEEH